MKLFVALWALAFLAHNVQCDADAVADGKSEASAEGDGVHRPHHQPPQSPSYYQPPPPPQYPPTHRPSYHTPTPAPYHQPSSPPYHHPQPQPHQPQHYKKQPPQYGHYEPPVCSKTNYNKDYCIEDPEYPQPQIEQAIQYHYDSVQQLYKDVLANTENSVDTLKNIVEETYLCPSETAYIKPRRAINTEGQWRIIVNDVNAHYETLTQTARIEECSSPGSPCPLVPACYETKCLQKSIYHRFLVYDPYAYDSYNQKLPFSIESFKLPASCACQNKEYIFNNHH